MRTRWTGLVAAAVTSIVVVAAGAFGSPAVAGDGLIDADPAEVTVDVPAPGHTESWTTQVRSTTDDLVDLGLEVSGSSEQLFSGPESLHMSIVDGAGQVIVDDQPVADVLDGTWDLEALAGREVREYTTRVWMPSDAGNEYQKASGQMKIRFVALGEDIDDDTPGVFPDLPSAGAPAVMGLTTLAVVLIAAGIAVGVRFSGKDDRHA